MTLISIDKAELDRIIYEACARAIKDSVGENAVKAEYPVSIEALTNGPNKICSRTFLYSLKDKKLLKFHYLGAKPFLYLSEIREAMKNPD